MNLLSEEVSFHINQLNRVQVQFKLLQCLFYLFPTPFLWGLYSHLYYISSFIFTLHVNSWGFILILVPSTSSRSLWEMVIRLKKYCSEVTSSLIRPGSKLQSIQCGGSSFLLDIFGFPYFLYVYGARPYH